MIWRVMPQLTKTHLYPAAGRLCETSSGISLVCLTELGRLEPGKQACSSAKKFIHRAGGEIVG